MSLLEAVTATKSVENRGNLKLAAALPVVMPEQQAQRQGGLCLARMRQMLSQRAYAKRMFIKIQ